MEGIFGVNDNRSGSLDFRQFAAIGVERLRARIEAGTIDTRKLQDELVARFGDDGSGIVTDDGTVDLDRLGGLAVDRQSTRLLLELTARFSEAREEAIRDDGTVDSEKLREELVSQRQAIARARIREEFGEDAERFFNADGSIDFRAMREFFEQQNAEFDRLRNLKLGPASLVDVET